MIDNLLGSQSLDLLRRLDAAGFAPSAAFWIEDDAPPTLGLYYKRSTQVEGPRALYVEVQRALRKKPVLDAIRLDSVRVTLDPQDVPRGLSLVGGGIMMSVSSATIPSRGTGAYYQVTAIRMPPALQEKLSQQPD